MPEYWPSEYWRPEYWWAIGIILIVISGRMRRGAGIGPGRQVAADNLTMVSHTLGLAGRPDRIVRKGGVYIPEEKKSAMRLYPGHRMQLGTYFLLMEEHFGQRPPHGYIVLGDGTRQKVENTHALRKQVLTAADAMRRSRRQPDVSLSRGHNNAAKCRSCAMAAYCNQKLS